MPGHDGEDPNRERIGLGDVAGLEAYSRVAQGEGEAHVSAQAVELGDEQHVVQTAGLLESQQQLGPRVAGPAFNFGVGVVQQSLVLDEVGYSGALAFQAQAAAALTADGDPVVGDVVFYEKGPTDLRPEAS